LPRERYLKGGRYGPEGGSEIVGEKAGVITDWDLLERGLL